MSRPPDDPSRTTRSRAARLHQLVGSAVLLTTLLGLVLLLTSPTVATPAARVAATIGSALEAERDDDLVLPVPSTAGLHAGLPVFFLGEPPESRPIAHVAAYGTGTNGPWVRLRFEPGATRTGPWSLRHYPPSRKIKAAYETVVTPEAAARFGKEVVERLEALWEDAVLPEARQHLPAFLARIDPTEDTQSRLLLDAFSKTVIAELEPLLDQLASHVTSAIKAKFDVLERLGLLWKAVSGDEKGLKKEILPVAKEAARAWWEGNQREVLEALGRAFSAHADEFKAWAGTELFEAARDELILPVLEAQGERLEAEGERLLRAAAKEFVEAPEGGFRVRFAQMLRTQLLNKKTALLLLERTE